MDADQTPTVALPCVQVDPMGREADHFQVLALTTAFGVRTAITYIDSSPQAVPTVHAFPDIPGEAVLHLLYRPGHYDIIVPIS